MSQLSSNTLNMQDNTPSITQKNIIKSKAVKKVSASKKNANNNTIKKSLQKVEKLAINLNDKDCDNENILKKLNKTGNEIKNHYLFCDINGCQEVVEMISNLSEDPESLTDLLDGIKFALQQCNEYNEHENSDTDFSNYNPSIGGEIVLYGDELYEDIDDYSACGIEMENTSLMKDDEEVESFNFNTTDFDEEMYWSSEEDER